MQDVLDVLIEARSLIADKAHWGQGHYVVEGTHGARRCTYGAMRQATRDFHPCSEHSHVAFKVLTTVANYYFGVNPISVNDHLILSVMQKEPVISYLNEDAHADTLFMFDKAIAGVREVMADLDTSLKEVELALL